MSADMESTEGTFEEDLPARGFGRILLLVSRTLALIGGLLLTLVVVVTTTSVLGRYLFNMPVPGDYELVEIGCGIAILLFFPYCEMSLGNIKAEFFTDRLSPRWKHGLNLMAEILFVGVASLLTWRFVVGGLRRMADGQAYMHLDIPFWWAYVPGSISMALLAVICVWRTIDFFSRLKERSAT